jgi:hypothetical protein
MYRWWLLIAACVFGVDRAALAADALSWPSVQPSANCVPANLLRISLVFPSVIDGEVLPRLTLAHADGRIIDQPFLPQELWSPDGRVLTLLLHPGRVKTGLVAREEFGPILVEGEDVVLALDGRPLKSWHVAPADVRGPMIAAWHLSPAAAGSRHPLGVTLDAAVDGRDAAYIAVADPAGRPLEGRGQLVQGETTWIFTPDSPWRVGAYHLMVRGTLEDPSGNRPAAPFEAIRLSDPQKSDADLSIPFKIHPSTRSS